MSDDLIRRSDAIKAYNEAMSELVKWQMEEWQLGDFSECEFNTTDCKHIARKIEAIPAIDVVSEGHGEWIKEGCAKGSEMCNQCGFVQFEGRVDNYCPNCGAHMKGADDE